MADPLLEPASKMPPGVVSQFPTTHSDEQAWVYLATILSTIVPGTLLLLRLYTKLRVFRKVDLTDCSGSIFNFAALPNKDVDLSTLSFVSNLESEMAHTHLLIWSISYFFYL